ncbi:hypothetical conserved protein [Candidatus Nitrosoglobus terrae]|uniref:Hypothetical conserved protein n=1 Tax=Candidatus Nitrosoglobus terrae TaxID=1630141 RepID=A0A1Q2SK09_9GAMM|nr:DUF3298 and DUF4163 domain-containing protein [Candidatus Nitrosoglobus terrae]BAW79457.1 hypothetical conserved protein [Candidatus Nitrosoglobus terrae]
MKAKEWLLIVLVSFIVITMLGIIVTPEMIHSAQVANSKATIDLIPTSIVPLSGDRIITKRYKITITLPTLTADEKPLVDAIRTAADNAKHEFLQALPDWKHLPEFADRQFDLLIDFKVISQIDTFISILETGSSNTGGAHPIPIKATFVYDRKLGKLITLADLFTSFNPALSALANFARSTLLEKFQIEAPKSDEGSLEAVQEWGFRMRQMLNEGTQPTAENYAAFIIQSAANIQTASPGIILVFPPYQIAPYASGTQTVEVPAYIFAQFLKPNYLSSFAIQ